ncbi:MAG: hypothetical protein Q8N16_03760 [bacterium]|nr:hypothetical protein [bacterium]
MKEKLVFLKRGEIRTMAKDLALLQEEEAIKERQRITGINKAEEGPRQAPFERERISQTIVPEPVLENKDYEGIPLPPKIKRSPPWKKALIRVLVVLVFLGFLFLVSFSYWFLVIKRSRPQPSPSPSPLSSPSPSPTPSESANPLIPPSPIISVKEIKIVRIVPESDLKTQLSETIKAVLVSENSPEFFELLPEKDNRYFNLKDFSDGLGLKSPESLFKSASDKTEDFDFFLYARGKSNKGLGLIVKLKDKESADQAVRTWEKTMVKDFANFFGALGKEASATGSIFKQTSYGGTFFRYLSFQEKNLGICWAIYKDYLIITSSGESIMKTIDFLKTNPAETN